jgi:Ala-tRNA(Pro) deacylase
MARLPNGAGIERQPRAPRPPFSVLKDRLALTGLALTQLIVIVPILVISLIAAAARLACAVLKRTHHQDYRSEEDTMGIAITVRDYLEINGRPYELIHHDKAFTSMETAAAAHVPGDALAKSVLLGNDYGYLVAVIPSTHRVDLTALRARLGHDFGLASEAEAMTIFRDCERGSIPPFGQAYGLPVLVDERLLEPEDLYCEAGDHSELVHMFGGDFRALMADARYGRISRHV